MREKKIPAEEYRARIPNVSQLAPTTAERQWDCRFRMLPITEPHVSPTRCTSVNTGS